MIHADRKRQKGNVAHQFVWSPASAGNGLTGWRILGDNSGSMQ